MNERPYDLKKRAEEFTEAVENIQGEASRVMAAAVAGWEVIEAMQQHMSSMGYEHRIGYLQLLLATKAQMDAALADSPGGDYVNVQNRLRFATAAVSYIADQLLGEGR